jgi:hypothetical protein
MNLPDISKYKEPKTKLNERQALLKEFLDILNSDRGKYPPIQPGRLGMLLAPIKTKDLYSFLAECKYATNFSKFFWWRCKK